MLNRLFSFFLEEEHYHIQDYDSVTIRYTNNPAAPFSGFATKVSQGCTKESVLKPWRYRTDRIASQN